MNAPRNFALRARYTKRGKVRFTSHRDVARLFERAVRVVGVPIAYSEGFSPRPRLSFGLALPTTFESDAEYVDMVLKDTLDPIPFAAPLSAALPDGIDVTDIVALEPGATSLQEVVDSVVWRLDVTGVDPNDADAWAASVVAADSIALTQERKGKQATTDVRPAILSLSTHHNGERDTKAAVTSIEAELATKPRALRPTELLEIFGPGFELVRGCRMHQWTTPDGARRDPIAAGAAQGSAQGMAHAS